MILSLRLEQCKKENKLPTFTNTLLESGRQKLRITMYCQDPNKRCIGCNYKDVKFFLAIFESGL